MRAPSCLRQISLAKSMNERLAPAALTANEANSHGADTAEAKAAASLATSSLARIGLVDAAVTADMMSDAQAYHHELARELGGILTRDSVGFVARGVMGLDEVWCLWNRARGVGEYRSTVSAFSLESRQDTHLGLDRPQPSSHLRRSSLSLRTSRHTRPLGSRCTRSHARDS